MISYRNFASFLRHKDATKSFLAFRGRLLSLFE